MAPPKRRDGVGVDFGLNCAKSSFHGTLRNIFPATYISDQHLFPSAGEARTEQYQNKTMAFIPPPSASACHTSQQQPPPSYVDSQNSQNTYLAHLTQLTWPLGKDLMSSNGGDRDLDLPTDNQEAERLLDDRKKARDCSYLCDFMLSYIFDFLRGDGTTVWFGLIVASWVLTLICLATAPYRYGFCNLRASTQSYVRALPQSTLLLFCFAVAMHFLLTAETHHNTLRQFLLDSAHPRRRSRLPFVVAAVVWLLFSVASYRLKDFWQFDECA